MCGHGWRQDHTRAGESGSWWHGAPQAAHPSPPQRLPSTTPPAGLHLTSQTPHAPHRSPPRAPLHPTSPSSLTSTHEWREACREGTAVGSPRSAAAWSRLHSRGRRRASQRRPAGRSRAGAASMPGSSQAGSKPRPPATPF